MQCGFYRLALLALSDRLGTFASTDPLHASDASRFKAFLSRSLQDSAAEMAAKGDVKGLTRLLVGHAELDSKR
jgi:hypothetical protein